MDNLTADEADNIICDVLLAQVRGNDIGAVNIMVAALLRDQNHMLGALMGTAGALAHELADAVGIPVEELIAGMRP